MKSILIIGAGGHGRVIAETALACGYDKIDFLDDHPSENVVGSLAELEERSKNYDAVIISIGNLELRRKITEVVERVSNPITTLVHPNAFVSPSAEIGKGSLVLPGAIVHTKAKVGKGCILSVGALIDHDAEIGDFCHINTGAIVGAGATVKDGTRIDAGECRERNT